jgi:hypothetical protein
MLAAVFGLLATAACAPDDQPIVFEVVVDAKENLVITVDDNSFGGPGSERTTLTYEIVSVEDLSVFTLDGSLEDGSNRMPFELRSRCLEPGLVAETETHVLHAYRLEFLEPFLDVSGRCRYTNGDTSTWDE